MAETTTPSVKKYYDYAQQQIDEQAILDKFNAATTAQFNAQREANRQAENQFYNQMYNTQKTAMDTIRQSNAAAVASGASRGVQAAQELSSLLGLQEESVASATELAQANRQTAQEETAAVLENVLNAYTQAQQERAQLVSQGIESASVDVQNEANKIAAQEAATRQQEVDIKQQEADQIKRDALQSAAETGTSNYLSEVAAQGKNYAEEYSLEGANSLNQATASLTAKGQGQANDGVYFTKDDFVAAGKGDSKTAQTKIGTLENNLKAICNTYGLDYNAYANDIAGLQELTKGTDNISDTWWGVLLNIATVGQVAAGEAIANSNEKNPETRAQLSQQIYNTIITRMKQDYANKANANKE